MSSTLSNQESIAVIGGGVMATSLIAGLVRRGCTSQRICVAEPDHSKRLALHAQYGVQVFSAAVDAIAGCQTWVIAVKPNVVKTVCEDIRSHAKTQQALVISIAAGITSHQLQHWLGDSVSIVRAMPNTPALLGAGITGVFAPSGLAVALRERADQLLASLGHVVWIAQEDQMDAVTAVSGSGPAYIFFVAQAMQRAACAHGLPSEIADTLVVQTIAGAAQMLLQTPYSADQLRAQVTSPQGTTHAGLAVLEKGQVDALLVEAIEAAYRRSKELSDEWN